MPSLALAVPAVLAAASLATFAASPALVEAERVDASGAMVTYGETLQDAPQARVRAEYDTVGDTRVELSVTGLEAATRYAGRVHVGGCERRRRDLGEVFQATPNPDPAGAPQDPAYRNPGNEVWLDLETDAAGTGSVAARQPWQFHPTRRPGSVIIHEMLPVSHPLDPIVGPALACLEVGF